MIKGIVVPKRLWASLLIQQSRIHLPMQETWVQSLGWIYLLEKVVLPEKSHGQRSLVGYHPWGCKELDTTEHACMLI